MTPFLSKHPESDSDIFAGTQGPHSLRPPDSNSRFSPVELIRIVLPPARASEGGHNERRVIVGRVSANDIAVADPLLSRQHFECIVMEGEWHVRDMNSKNGTVLNETQLTSAPVGLTDGDKLRAGSSVFVVSLQ